eukprot:c22308_g2_i6 orf=3-1793(-)
MGVMSEGSAAGTVGCLTRLCQEGRLIEALQAVAVLDRQGVWITRSTVFRLLQGCIKQRDLAAGREINSLITRRGFNINTFFGSHLIRMFASCGSLSDADMVFRKLSDPSVYTWHAIISAHAKLGQSERAIQLYHKLVGANVKPNEYIYVAVLKACASLTDLTEGNLIFSYSIEDGLESDLFIGNTMMDTYAKCGCLEDAHKVFASLKKRDCVSWNALITGYALHAHGLEAIQLLQQMQQEGMQPDDVTYASVIKACSSITDLGKGELIHHSIFENGVGDDAHVSNILIHMYMACGSLDDANRVFEKLQRRDVVTWSTIISGYAHHGHGAEAFKAFESMLGEGLKPNNVTYPSILKACASLFVLDQGRLIHLHILESDYDKDLFIGSALIDMYAKCGSITKARKVFNELPQQGVAAWNAIISGYAHDCDSLEALHLFQSMQAEGVEPNNVTFISILKACCFISALQEGKLIHANALYCVDEMDVVLQSALIDFYAKHGCLEDAQWQFDNCVKQDLVPCNAMMTGYVQHGRCQEAVGLFLHMQKEGIMPDIVTFIALLQACSMTIALVQGKLIHDYVMQSDFSTSLIVGNALIDMYAKC